MKAKIILSLSMLLIAMSVSAQGVVIRKTDGSSITIPYAELDSIVTYKAENDTVVKVSDAVDLGLPSGLKWATCNVGATSPEQFGGYYAWGEIEEKEVYYYENYLYNNKDIGTDISGTQYDVAHVKWGNGWRMPTRDELDELRSNCTWTWSQYNGIKGMLVTGPNGNSIFLPASGWKGYPGYVGVGECANYWSSTYSTNQWAYDLGFGSSAAGDITEGTCNGGQSVRPVKD